MSCYFPGTDGERLRCAAATARRPGWRGRGAARTGRSRGLQPSGKDTPVPIEPRHFLRGYLQPRRGDAGGLRVSRDRLGRRRNRGRRRSERDVQSELLLVIFPTAFATQETSGGGLGRRSLPGSGSAFDIRSLFLCFYHKARCSRTCSPWTPFLPTPPHHNSRNPQRSLVRN